MDFKDRLLANDIRHLHDNQREMSRQLILLQDFILERYGDEFQEFARSKEKAESSSKPITNIGKVQKARLDLDGTKRSKYRKRRSSSLRSADEDSDVEELAEFEISPVVKSIIRRRDKKRVRSRPGPASSKKEVESLEQNEGTEGTATATDIIARLDDPVFEVVLKENGTSDVAEDENTQKIDATELYDSNEENEKVTSGIIQSSTEDGIFEEDSKDSDYTPSPLSHHKIKRESKVSAPGSGRDHLRFPCGFCRRKFADSKPRDKHEEKVHSRLRERGIKCNYCEKYLRDTTRLREHEKCHTGEQPKCYRCHQSFTRSDALNRHVRREICLQK